MNLSLPYLLPSRLTYLTSSSRPKTLFIMERDNNLYAVLFVLCHVASFAVISLVQYYRAKDLYDQYAIESAKLDILESQCKFQEEELSTEGIVSAAFDTG